MSPDGPRPARWAGACLVGATALLAGLLLRPGPPGEEGLLGGDAAGRWAAGVARATYDDGFYYLEIARRVAGGEGSSFDGLHATNGYHPLWLLLLVPILRLCAGPAGALLATAALQALLLAAALLVLERVARARLEAPAALLCALGFLQFALSYRQALSGLEFALQALLMLLLVEAHARAWSAPGLEPRAALRLGLLVALLFLARLDTLALGLLVLAWWAARLRGQEGGARRLVALCGPLLLALAAYLAFGALAFGDPRPVSAFLKREWSQRLLASDPLLLGHGRLVAELHDAVWPVLHQRRSFWMYLGLGLLGPPALALLPSGRRFLAPLLPFVAFAWLQYLGAVAFMHSGYGFQPWYYLATPILACLVAARAAEGLAARAPRLSRACLYAAGAGLVAFSLVSAERWRRETLAAPEPLHAAAAWARAHVGPGERAGAWNAGAIAFLSGRQVVPLDGLVNSWDYARRGRHELCAYWRENDVRVLVDAFDTRDRFGFLDQALPCLQDLAPLWVGPAFRRDPAWRIEAYAPRF